MDFGNYLTSDRFHQAWNSVGFARRSRYSLFTFGDTDLPYYLICEPSSGTSLVSVIQGNMKISKPVVYMPGNAPPELHDFFEDESDGDLIGFLMARTDQFRNMKFDNRIGSGQLVSDSVEEIVNKLKCKLDEDEEDRVAIITSPAGMGGLAVLRYSLERIAHSAPENVAELRERGFLP